MVSLVLYLCSQTSELRAHGAPGRRPVLPEPKKVKAGWRLFPPPRPDDLACQRILA